MSRFQIYILFAILQTIFLSSCNSIRYLEKKKEIGPSDYLLYSLDVAGNTAVSKDRFVSLYQQKTNRKMPLLGSSPYFYFYIIGKSFHFRNRIQHKIEKTEARYDYLIRRDTLDKVKVEHWRRKKEKKIEKLTTRLTTGNGFMRTFGEAPSIANKETIEKSALLMQKMLQARGYFHARVSTLYDTSGKKLKVTYLVAEGPPHRIDTMRYLIPHLQVARLIDSLNTESVLKAGSIYDESDLGLERDRIDKLLKNHGYFDFEKQTISFNIDSNLAPYRVNVELVIRKPERTPIFRRYTLDSVFCYLEYNKFSGQKVDTLRYDHVSFLEVRRKFGKKVLAGKIKFRPGNYYSADATVRTQLNLASLDNFKYIDIRYTRQSDADSTLHAHIILNSSKKYQITDEWGLNVTQGLPGPQASISFLDRNILKGCENFDFSVRYSIEGVASASNPDVVYKSVEAAVDMGITFPQLYIPTRIRFKFNNLFPRTRLNVAFNNVVRPEYLRQSYKLALNYTFTRNIYSRYIFAIADLNVINSSIKSDIFQGYLDTLRKQGNSLYRSFQPSFVSSISFTYLYNNNDFTKFSNGHFFRFFAESGGTTLHFLETQLRQQDIIREQLLFGKLAYYKFVKTNVEYRRYVVTSPRSQLAMKINTGAAITFDQDALPYEKYFFAGGSNSIRAWRPRRLGPGARAPFTRKADGSFDYRFEQPAKIILEASIESRFKIIKYLEGAIFADAGNVWEIGPSLTSEASEDFNPARFYKEIALGTGAGIRLNFSFIIVRFDLGVKVFDPAYEAGKRFIIKNWTWSNLIGKNEYGILNLGIGYPF